MASSFKMSSLFRASRMFSSKPLSPSPVSAAEKAQLDPPYPSSSSSAAAAFCPEALPRLCSTKESSDPPAISGSDNCDYWARKQISSAMNSVLNDGPPTPDVIAETEKNKSKGEKKKWIFKSNQERRYQQFIKSIPQEIDAEAAMKILEKLGRKPGIKEYNALIQRDKASDDHLVTPRTRAPR